MRIALFKNVELDYQSIIKQSSYEDDSACMPGYVRISEWRDVEFDMLPEETVLMSELAELGSMIKHEGISRLQKRWNDLSASLGDDQTDIDLPIIRRQAE